ncbi:MAG: restriction endonuclease [Lachnospiraceae bacterium]|nr:restriction endonuclease [Lachnospiraceae bacterium]
MIDKSEYPKNQEWNAKLFSVPKIPRGEKGQLHTLKMMMQAVRDGLPAQTILKIKGSDSKAALDRYCVWLRPLGFVYKEDGRWQLSEEGQKWLDSGDDSYLTAIFCARIKFFGEVLYYLQEPKKIGELLQIAQNDYKINWKTKSEIANRLTWFREVGFVEFTEYLLEYSLTEKGQHFLQDIPLVYPQEIVVEKDETIGETDVDLSSWAIELCKAEQENFSSRKPTIGYIPGNTNNAAETIVGYLQLLSQEVTRDRIREYSGNMYHISTASSNMFMTLLMNIGFVERKSKNTYKISELGDQWLEKNNMIDLLCCIHSKFLFVFEILKELEEKSLSAKELAVIAKVSYGFNRESIDEMRRRLILLKEAKLIMENSADTYCLTKRGTNLLKLICIQERKASDTSEKDSASNSRPVEDDDLLRRIRLASKDSANPQEFEKVLQEAFETLGFKAEWLGGSGKTDVLLQAVCAPKLSFRVAIDAKSTSAGNVPENQIDFDTLKEHKKIHEADYTMVVGCSFQGERLQRRAREHKVALLDIDGLEELLKAHREIPIPVSAYKKIFEQSGIVDLDVLNDERNRVRRYGFLVEAIMKCLLEESDDPITKGALSIREIYRSIRDNESFDMAPEPAEIEAILDFLSSPLIDCVGKNGKEYFIIGSLDEASKKFEFYSKACMRKNSKE